MSKSRNALRVDYEGVMQGAVGRKHGLAKKDLKGLAGRVARIVGAVEAERKKGDHRYRDLPRDRRMLEAVEAACRRHRDRCDTLVVCGIGGSALGNIALQTALNPFTYNLLPRKRRGGPRLFVMDNVDPMQFGAVLDLIGDKLNSTDSSGFWPTMPNQTRASAPWAA